MKKFILRYYQNDKSCTKQYLRQLCEMILEALDIPMMMLGRDEFLEEMGKLNARYGIIRSPGRSLFVFKGIYRVALINYSGRQEKENLFLCV